MTSNAAKCSRSWAGRDDAGLVLAVERVASGARGGGGGRRRPSADRVATAGAGAEPGHADPGRTEQTAARDAAAAPGERLGPIGAGSALRLRGWSAGWLAVEAVDLLISPTQMTAAASLDSGSDRALTASDSSLTSGLLSSS